MEFKGFKYPQPNRADINAVTVMTPRLKKLKHEWENARQDVYVDDTILFTESWKETVGMPVDYRWAKAYEKRLLNCPLLLREDELVIGSTTKFIRGCNTLAAMKPREILAFCESGHFDRKSSDTASDDIDPKDLEALKEDCKYWVDHIPEDNWANWVITPVREEMGEEFLNNFFDRAGVYEGRAPRINPDRGLFQGQGAYGGGDLGPTPLLIDTGLYKIIEMCQAEIDKMWAEGCHVRPGQPNTWAWRKFWILKSCMIMCQATIDYAKRYSELAAEQAAVCTNPERKAELLKIADVCAHVPGNQPRDFWEAVQSFRFLHMILYKESPERPAVPIGAIDRILYPYYEKDLKEGKITRQFAAEMLGALWLKTRENESLVTIKREHRAAPGTLLPDVTICGIDENGLDMTNEISWLVLEVMRQTMLSEPTIYVRYHDKMNHEFMMHALDCNRDFGGGNPAFLNDALGTGRYMDRGIPASDACYWSASGCLGYHLDCSEHMSGILNLNHPKIFEIMMHDGMDPRTGLKCAPALAHVADFKSAEDVQEALLKYEDYYIEKGRMFHFHWWGSEDAHSPTSGMRIAYAFRDCIPNGLGIREGGSRYNICRAHWFGDRGMTDLGDDLAAVKYVVYDKKICTLEELIKACDANFEGYDEIYAACKQAPKYGNDDEYVDDLYSSTANAILELLQKRPEVYISEKPMLFKGAASGHVNSGKTVGATPNGRKAGMPLNDAATSAGAGVDVNGPTANINSATSAPRIMYEYCGCTHNIKFSKGVVNNDEKIERLIGLVETFMKRGGWHIQFNMLSNEEMIDAKVHPENHKDLLVRVGGYSAYFVDLPWELQDEIISRTCQSL